MDSRSFASEILEIEGKHQNSFWFTMQQRRFFILALLLGLIFPHLNAQLTVQSSVNGNNLANLLIGQGITISNVTLNCPTDASGTFDATNTNLNLTTGVLLTSGSVANAALPNTTGSTTQANFAPGDNDLNVLSGVTTFDACALEFDMVPTCDTISISYVFASEEYDEYVCSTVNDAFGFFIDGPGLNNVNVALIPGSTTPVSINSVNNGTLGLGGSLASPNCNLNNSAFFTSNNTGTTHEYDGQTVRLEAKTWVQPCSTYRVKLVIADGGDEILDSGVFLEAGGIRCTGNEVDITTAFTNGAGYLVEGCSQAALSFTRDGSLSQPLTLNYVVTGSATNGADYSPLPGSVTFAPGQDSVAVVVVAPDDGISEGSEFLNIIIGDTTCSSIFSDTAVVEIVDPPVADFILPVVCPNIPVNLTDASMFPPGNIVAWEWDFGNGQTSTDQNPTATWAPGTYTIQLIATTVEGCQDTVTQNLTVTPLPVVDFSAQNFCLGDGTQFDGQVTLSPGDVVTNFDWQFGDGNGSAQEDPTYSYISPGFYTVTFEVTNANGCLVDTSQVIEILPEPVAGFNWTDVCDEAQMDFVNTSSVVNGTITSLDWDLGDGTTQTQPQFSHLYGAPGTYTVQLEVATSDGCTDLIQQNVTVHPNPEPNFEVSFACLDDTSFFTDLSTILTGSIVSYDWQFGNGAGSSQANPAYVYPMPGLYNINLTTTSDQGCVTTFTGTNEVPEGPIDPVPLHDTVCRGFAPEVAVVRPPGPGNLFWYTTPDGTAPFQSNLNSYSPGPGVNTTYYFVEFIDGDGCPSARIPVVAYVNVPPNVPIEFSALEAEIPNAIIEFNADVPPMVVSQQWTFGDGGASEAANAVHQYSDPGVYDISFYFLDENGCERTYEWTQHISIEENIHLWIPNAFTPDGTGPAENETWGVQTELISDLEVQVFDRWGKLVYQSTNPAFRWNGTDLQGQPLPEGAYMYRIDAVAFRGQRVQRSGSVTIIR